MSYTKEQRRLDLRVFKRTKSVTKTNRVGAMPDGQANRVGGGDGLRLDEWRVGAMAQSRKIMKIRNFVNKNTANCG